MSKYDSSGNIQWTRQLGTSGYDIPHDVAADGLGNVFISGRTGGDLDGTNAGSEDAFVSKYDTSGNIQWTRQFGTSVNERTYGVAVDGLGNVFISGGTQGDLFGPNAGNRDAFVVKLVPEPSTLILLCMAAVGLLAFGWRRRRSSSRLVALLMVLAVLVGVGQVTAEPMPTPTHYYPYPTAVPSKISGQEAMPPRQRG